jgi:hypothetical protein
MYYSSDFYLLYLFKDFLGQQIRRSENTGILADVSNLKSVRDNMEVRISLIFVLYTEKSQNHKAELYAVVHDKSKL